MALDQVWAKLDTLGTDLGAAETEMNGRVQGAVAEFEVLANELLPKLETISAGIEVQVTNATAKLDLVKAEVDARSGALDGVIASKKGELKGKGEEAAKQTLATLDSAKTALAAAGTALAAAVKSAKGNVHGPLETL